MNKKQILAKLYRPTHGGYPGKFFTIAVSPHDVIEIRHIERNGEPVVLKVTNVVEASVVGV